MLARAGLYYPYIHFRDDNWMKAAALYWPAMARIVPVQYLTRDSYAITALRSELNFIQDIHPGQATFATAQKFLELLRQHGPELAERLHVESITATSTRQSTSPRRLGFIYTEKMTEALRFQLFELGLAVQRTHGEDLRQRLSLETNPASWIGMDERLAWVYMCVLTEELSRRNSLTPVTDQVGALVAVGGWTMEEVANILLGTDLGQPLDEPTEQLSDQTSRVAYLALEVAMPKGLPAVPVEEIIRFRKRHPAALSSFQDAVASAAADLSTLDKRIDQAMLDQYLHDVVEVRFAQPKRDLERALKGFKWETALTSLTVQTALPAVATGGTVGVTLDPLVGAVAGAAVGVASLATSTRKAKTHLLSREPAADYLLRIQRELKPRGAVRNCLKTLLRT